MSAITTDTFQADQKAVEHLLSSRTRIDQELAKVIVGQKKVIEQLLIALFAGGHCLITGAPGLAKTLLVKSIAQIFQLQYQRIQFTPDLMPADITGTEILDSSNEGRRLVFMKGPIFANMILADEINRTPPKTQAALLEAMQEHQVTAAGVRHVLQEPFFVLATQNPIEMEGNYPLPEAQLDRFMFKINVEFPSSAELGNILNRTTGQPMPGANRVIGGAQILDLRRLARLIPVPSHVTDFVARLVVATHPEQASAPPMTRKYIRYGSSPRGAQALILGAKITALLAGRLNVAYDDVAAVAPAALRHRLLLNFEGQAEEITTDAVVVELLRSVEKEGRNG